MRAEYIDHMGTDLTATNAARVSFAKEAKLERRVFEERKEAENFAKEIGGWIDEDYVYADNWFGGYPVEWVSEKDVKLIKYLADHDHWSPFGHPHISIRMAAPVPIRTQCFKHKQGFVESEESRRYISSRPELFVPEYFRSKPEGSIKQGSGDEHPHSKFWKTEYIIKCNDMIYTYEKAINEGVCPEQARFFLPQGVIVNWIWTGSLYAYANFYNKRTDSHAQKEIQDLAKSVDKIIRPLFPVSWAALVGGAK